MSLYEFLGTLEVAFIFGFVALGAYLSFRILDFPDLTVEGSFPLGAAVAAVLLLQGWSPWPATMAAGASGFLAGLATGYLNVRFKIVPILAGILIAIALYSINLRVMGGPNVPLLATQTVFSSLQGWGVPTYMLSPVLLGILLIAVKFALDLFLQTGVGIRMRAAGANAAMAAANGVNVGQMKLFGIGLANLLTALAGALFAQVFGAADAHMGIGVIIVGLASVIVGMSIFPTRTILQATLACLLGALLYRFAVALALNANFLGLHASDLQLVTAVLVIATLIGPSPRAALSRLRKRSTP